MGMYTELVFKAQIKNDPAIMPIINYLFGDGEEPAEFPDHEFFKCNRWTMIGSCSSYYHHPKAVNSVHNEHKGNPYVFSRSDLKNYCSEIEMFIDWIDPYLDEIEGTCIGWSWYEEHDSPNLLFKK